MKTNKAETFYLYWLNPVSNRRYPAGVAFYEEGYGEYRLKVDSEAGKKFYLRTIGTVNNQIVYRLEEATRRKDRLVRVEVGRGSASLKKPESIHIEMVPNFGAILSLELKANA